MRSTFSACGSTAWSRTVRVFVALEVADDIAADISSAAARVRALDPAWATEKWVAPENLHVTLAFAGDLDAAGAGRLVTALGPALGPLEGQDLALTALTAVPSPRRAAMLWAVPGRDTPRIAAVARLVAECVVAAGGENDERPFRAHLTLVRARRPRRIGRGVLESAWVPDGAPGKAAERIVSGATVTVFSSTLTPTGPVYEALARIPVGDA